MKLKDIHRLIGGDLIVGQQSVKEFTSINIWELASKTDVVFLFNRKPPVTQTKAGLIITNQKHEVENVTQIIHEQPRLALAKLLKRMYPLSNQPMSTKPNNICIDASVKLSEPVGINAFTSIGKNSVILENTVIGSNVSIGNNCSIGKGCVIHSNVTLYDNVSIGDGTIIHSGARIGADGFGYELHNSEWEKLIHIGSVEIGKNVEIGANSTIDRGCLSKTIIGNGVKIDNLVHIAHNVSIGNHTVIVAGVLVGGGCKIGEHCQIAGNVAISDNITIGNSVVIMAQSGVTKSIPDNLRVSGFPAQEHQKEVKMKAILRKKINHIIENIA